MILETFFKGDIAQGVLTKDLYADGVPPTLVFFACTVVSLAVFHLSQQLLTSSYQIEHMITQFRTGRNVCINFSADQDRREILASHEVTWKDYEAKRGSQFLTETLKLLSDAVKCVRSALVRLKPLLIPLSFSDAITSDSSKGGKGVRVSAVQSAYDSADEE